jgi:hypothetical protein
MKLEEILFCSAVVGIMGHNMPRSCGEQIGECIQDVEYVPPVDTSPQEDEQLYIQECDPYEQDTPSFEQRSYLVSATKYIHNDYL